MPALGSQGVLPLLSFRSPAGRESVADDLGRILASGVRGIRCAICFFRRAGVELLKPHATRLRGPTSFVVASIDSPTDLDAVRELHELAPGNVYLHLGGITPFEPGVGRALMHSKVVLAAGEDAATAWIGSHNFTAQAIEGGNFEASLAVLVSADDPVLQDIERHLETCRATAEAFDLASMDRYRRVQKERERGPDRDCRILIVHAEQAQPTDGAPFAVEIALGVEQFDRHFLVGMDVHLFLHAPGSLRSGSRIDTTRAAKWAGRLTSFGHTEKHRENGGVRGRFEGARFQITVPDQVTAPTFDVNRPAPAGTRSQAVVRIDRPLEIGRRVYSLSTGSMLGRLEPVQDGEDQYAPLDQRYAKFFSSESVEGSKLVLRSLRDRRPGLRARGYAAGLPDVERVRVRTEHGTQEYRFSPEFVQPTRMIDPFISVARRYVDVDELTE